MSYTKHTSFVPMSPVSPVSLPRQKLNAVVTIPELPKGLAPKVELVEPLLRDPPKASPRKLTFLFSVEWSWSPMHHRIDNYYLNPRRTSWLLWNNDLDDGTVPWSWHWLLYAHCAKAKCDEKTIAIHLIKALWESEAEHQAVDQYHWINNTGLLSVEEIQALGRAVW